MPVFGNGDLKKKLNKLKENILEHGLVILRGHSVTFNKSIEAVKEEIKKIYDKTGKDADKRKKKHY